MKQCRLCKNYFPKLVKAHIIPRSFYQQYTANGRKPVRLSAGGGRISERQHQSGIWNHDIVCADCESEFKSYDTHGYRVLKDVTRLPVYENPPGHPLAYMLEQVDYRRLKLFFLSVLWRAHWSSDWFFRHVDLGPHEPIIADFIKRGVAPPPEVYSVYLYHLTDVPVPNAMFPPRQQHLEDTDVHYLYLPGVVVMITTDVRELPPWINPMRLNVDPPHLVAFLPYVGSEEEKHFEGMIAEMRKANVIPKRMRR